MPLQIGEEAVSLPNTRISLPGSEEAQEVLTILSSISAPLTGHKLTE